MAEANDILKGKVTLIIEGDERVLVAERNFLANRFKYFGSLFKGGFKEAHAEKIILKGGDVLSFDALKLLAWSGGYEAVTESNIGSLLKAADYLELHGTSLLSLYNQAKRRSPRTLLENFNILHRLFKENIESDRKNGPEPAEIVGRNLKTLMFARGWPNLELEHILKILSYGQKYSVLEILVQGMKIWINHDYEGRKEFLPQFFTLIKGIYNYADLDYVLEMILNLEPRKMDGNYVAIDILLQKLQLTSLKAKLEIKE